MEWFALRCHGCGESVCSQLLENCTDKPRERFLIGQRNNNTDCQGHDLHDLRETARTPLTVTVRLETQVVEDSFPQCHCAGYRMFCSWGPPRHSHRTHDKINTFSRCAVITVLALRALTKETPRNPCLPCQHHDNRGFRGAGALTSEDIASWLLQQWELTQPFHQNEKGVSVSVQGVKVYCADTLCTILHTSSHQQVAVFADRDDTRHVCANSSRNIRSQTR